MTPSHVSLFIEPVCLVNLIIVKEVGPGSQHNSNFLRGAIAADKLHQHHGICHHTLSYGLSSYTALHTFCRLAGFLQALG